MSTPHTPGPWTNHGEAVWSTHESVSGTVTKGARTNHVCAVSTRLKMPDAERRANARLIAAAPQLLDAITAMLEYITDPKIREWLDRSGYKSDEYGSAVVMARAAIAKAKGAA